MSTDKVTAEHHTYYQSAVYVTDRWGDLHPAHRLTSAQLDALDALLEARTALTPFTEYCRVYLNIDPRTRRALLRHGALQPPIPGGDMGVSGAGVDMLYAQS